MTIVLIFVLLYVSLEMWDIVHANDLLWKMVDPEGYQRAHPGAPVEPAPLLAINLPSARQA